MKHLALLLFFALPLAAQFPPSGGKPLKIEIDDVPAGVARTLSLIPGTGVSMSGDRKSVV